MHLKMFVGRQFIVPRHIVRYVLAYENENTSTHM